MNVNESLEELLRVIRSDLIARDDTSLKVPKVNQGMDKGRDIENYWLAIVRPRRLACAPGELCHVDSPAMRVNRVLFWTSVAIWAGAVTFTYAALWWARSQA